MQAKFIAACLAVMFVLCAAVWVPAVEDKGAAQLVLEGGATGNVPFPHHRHQAVLTDCNVCHEVFDRQNGAIEKLKAAGKLEPKEVMNKLCTSCHKEKRLKGEKTGPVTCRKCHVKE
jgi:hypothetical protein